MTLRMYYIGLNIYIFLVFICVVKLTYVVISHMMVRIIMTTDEPIPLMCGPWTAVLVYPGKSRFQHDGH